MSILNACVDADSVKTIAPVEVCTDWTWVETNEGGSLADRRSKVCVATELVSLSQPLAYEKSFCKRFRSGGDSLADRMNSLPESCAKWGVKTATTQTTFYPTVREVQGAKEELATVKRYSLPACN